MESSNDPAVAFAGAYREARDEWGHSGYSGTICEKDGFVVYPYPDDLVDWEELMMTLTRCNSFNQDEDLVGWYGKELARKIAHTFIDKWGPACAFEVEPEVWLFCGWASC
jgi:hypothetical protein